MARKSEANNYTERCKRIKIKERKAARKELKRILQIFKDADTLHECNAIITGEFNSMWRYNMGCEFTRLPFSTLLTAFHERYETITPNYPPQLQHRHVAGEGETLAPIPDFPHNTNGDGPHLDNDTVEEILRRLPLPSLIRAKSVCKAWNTAILASTFNLDVETHHFVTQGFHGIAFFSAALNRWFRIPLPLPWDRYNPKLYLWAAAGGLFLFFDWESWTHRSSVIFNPVTKQQRILPRVPLHYSLGRAVELIHAESGHFKIITIGYQVWTPTDWCPLVYNSATDEWTDIPTTHAIPITETHHWTSALHNGVVYFTNNYGHYLGCYDIACGEFQFMEIEGGLPPQMDSHDHPNNLLASLPCLVACNGKLLLVGRLQREAEEDSIWGRFPFIEHTLVGIWELDSKSENNKF